MPFTHVKSFGYGIIVSKWSTKLFGRLFEAYESADAGCSRKMSLPDSERSLFVDLLISTISLQLLVTFHFYSLFVTNAGIGCAAVPV